jgi:hypothetical protein
VMVSVDTIRKNASFMRETSAIIKIKVPNLLK